MFDLLAAGDAVRGQMKDTFGLEARPARRSVQEGRRRRVFLTRAAPTNALVSRTSRRSEVKRRACPEGAGH